MWILSEDNKGNCLSKGNDECFAEFLWKLYEKVNENKIEKHWIYMLSIIIRLVIRSLQEFRPGNLCFKID